MLLSRLVLVAVAASLCSLAACNREIAGGKADGPAIFAQACARCHGPEGVPTSSMKAQLGAADLTSVEMQTRMSDEDILRQIRKGSENRRMPPFAQLTEEQMAAILKHVRSLARPASRVVR